MNNVNNSHVHMGARELDPKNVKRIIPNVQNIENIIDTFRQNASQYLAKKNNCRGEEYTKEQFDNVISILGNRGTGKTSTMLTIISEIKKGTFFKENAAINENHYDLFSGLIAPEDMSENSNILGWIIVVLENFYLEMKEIVTKNYISNVQDSQREIEELFISVKSAYQYRKRESNRIISDNFSNMDDFARTKIKIEENDMMLVPLFFRIVDLLIDIKRRINQSACMGDNRVPLIFFCFDDVDVDTKHSVSILRDIITFLSHPNIVVLVSGDYKIFSQTATLNMLEAENVQNNELNNCYIYGTDPNLIENTAIELAKSRSEFLLRKVLPPLYRFELLPLNNEDKAEITYTTPQQGVFSLSGYNIVQLICELFNLSFDKENDKNFLYISKKSFLSSGIWSIELYNNNQHPSSEFYKQEMAGIIPGWNEEIENEMHVVYPYLSIFSSSIRGFMNVYNHLYNMLVLKTRLENEEIGQGDAYVHNLGFLKVLLQIILQSKSTFLRYKNEINKYIRIEHYDDGSDDLVIDCEELKIFMETNYHPSTQKDIKSFEALVFLPIFFNELAYLIFSYKGDDSVYIERYKSVQIKLQEIFSKIFLRKINPILSSCPNGFPRKMTYILYHRVTTRMSINALSALLSYRDEDHDLKSKVSIRNDKKYFVQLFQCFLLFYEVCYFVRQTSDNQEKYYVLLCDIKDGENTINVLIDISLSSSNLLLLKENNSHDLNKKEIFFINNAVFNNDTLRIKNETFYLRKINGEEYRKVLVNDKAKRALYESVIYFYLCVRFGKNDYSWISQFKTQLKLCVNNFDYTDPVRRGLFPCQLFIRREIWPIYENIEDFNEYCKSSQNHDESKQVQGKSNQENNQGVKPNLDEVRDIIRQVYSLLDVRLIFDEDQQYELRKKFKEQLAKWCKVYDQYLEDQQYPEHWIEEVKSSAHYILEDQDLLMINLYKIRRCVKKETTEQSQDETEIEEIGNDVAYSLINDAFEELKQLYSKFKTDRYTDQLTDMVYQVYSIISDNFKIDISSIEDIVFNKLYEIVRHLLLDASIDGIESVVDNIENYIRIFNIQGTNDVYESTKKDIRSYLTRQVRTLRLNEGYDEKTLINMIDVYIFMIPIYVMSKYLMSLEVDKSTKNDHEFFYRLYMVLANYEQFNIINRSLSFM